MGFFGIVLLVLFAIVCALLIFLVIIQDQEGEGLGGIFSGAGSAAFGSRSSSVVVKFTYILGGLFFVIAFSLALMNRAPDLDNLEPSSAVSTEIRQAEVPADEPSATAAESADSTEDSGSTAENQ